MGKEQLVIEIDAELMARLRDAGVDPQAYVQRLVDRKAAEAGSDAERMAADGAWAERNREALAEYNAQVERIGTFASRQRARRA